MGTLSKSRYVHGSIALGDHFMVVGGASDSGAPEKETEIWNVQDETNIVVNPTLPNWFYIDGVGLYQVPFNFCTT